MKIKILEKTPGCMPEIIKKGDWIDLRLGEDVHLIAPYVKTVTKQTEVDGKTVNQKIKKIIFNSVIADLGICVQVPKGYESIVVPRSSTFKNYGVMQTNSVGVIDQTYSSNEDVWKMPMIAFREVVIPKGTRVAQFRIQLSQKATVWQRLKWHFTSSIKIEKVSTLGNEVRGGFGSTGQIEFKTKENVKENSK